MSKLSRAFQVISGIIASIFATSCERPAGNIETPNQRSEPFPSSNDNEYKDIYGPHFMLTGDGDFSDEYVEQEAKDDETIQDDENPDADKPADSAAPDNADSNKTNDVIQQYKKNDDGMRAKPIYGMPPKSPTESI